MEKKIYGVVYGLIDGTNDFEYIGQTTRSIEKRFKRHMKADSYIGRAIRDHGVDMFTTVILKVCYSKEELDRWERHMIRSRDTKAPSGYNLTDGGEGTVGLKFTPEHRAKIGASNRGKKRTPEMCAKIGMRNKGKTLSAEQIAKLKVNNTGEKNPNFGKHWSAEKCFNSSVERRGKSPYKNLIEEMDKHKLSYAALAKLLGLASISKKMRSKRDFSSKDITKLVEIFGLPAEYLMTRDDNKNSWHLKRCKSPYRNLVATMEEFRITYTIFAELLGISQQSVSAKMRGEQNFTAAQVAKLVEIFGKPADYLMKRDE